MSEKRIMPSELYDFYKSSPMREGLLCWYPFKRDSSVLDLSGGVLTDLLKNRCTRVVSDEATNNELFDYIVILDPDDFSVDALKALREHLDTHGRLLLAYENPFALRYWNGKPDPVTAKPYVSLFGRGGKPSAAELRIRMNRAEFEGQKWYYPLTDHWLTQEVYSEDYLPDEYMNQRFLPYMADYDTMQFDERGLYREMIRGGAFQFMCGAYLVEARVCADDEPCFIDYAAVTANRETAKRFATVICKDGRVCKTPLHPDGLHTVNKILKIHRELAELGVNVLKIEQDDETLVMPYISHPTLQDYWARKLTLGIFDEDEMFRQFDCIREAIYKSSSTGKCFWELVPANCFYDEKADELIFFDQEYCWEGISPDVAVVRALWALNYSPAFKADKRTPLWLEELKARFKLAKRWDELSELADKKTSREVFGDGALELAHCTGRALGIISKRRAEYSKKSTEGAANENIK